MECSLSFSHKILCEERLSSCSWVCHLCLGLSNTRDKVADMCDKVRRLLGNTGLRKATSSSMMPLTTYGLVSLVPSTESPGSSTSQSGALDTFAPWEGVNVQILFFR